MSTQGRGRGHIRPRGDAWEVRLYAGVDPATGRERRITRTVRGSRREAERVRTRLLAELDEGGHAGPDGTLGQLLDAWVALKAPRWSPKTTKETRAYIRRWVHPPEPGPGAEPEDVERWRRSPGRLPLRQVTTAALDEWLTWLLGQLAGPTVARIRGIVRAALEQGVRWGWVTGRNPAAYTEEVPASSAEIVPPPPGDVARLLVHLVATEPELALLVRLAAVLGRRRGELCALRWSDFDLEAGVVRVARTIVDSEAVGWVERPITKNKRRTPPLAMDAGTVALLRAHQVACADRLAALGVEQRPGGHVFVRLTRSGALAPWSPDVVSRRWAEARTAVGLDGVRLHDLRHFVATTLLDEGVSLTTVAGRLGHGDGGRTTQDVYAHWLPATDGVAADLLGDLLDGLSEQVTDGEEEQAS